MRAIERIVGRPWPGIVIATNDAGYTWPHRLEHWVTLHPDKLEAWRKERKGRGYPPGFTTWTRKNRRHSAADRFAPDWRGGASGLLAVTVAHELNCSRAVLCGVPMTAIPHFHNRSDGGAGPWKVADRYWRAWDRNKSRMLGWVRSMSGRTAELLGTPDREWFDEAIAA